jgi:hypothetical protein
MSLDLLLSEFELRSFMSG